MSTAKTLVGYGLFIVVWTVGSVGLFMLCATWASP